MKKRFWRGSRIAGTILGLSITFATATMAATELAPKTLMPVQVGGYIDTEWISNISSNTFKAHRLVLGISAHPHDKISFNSEIEFEYGGLVNSGANNGQIKIEQAWMEYTVNDAIHFRTGILLVPFGQLNKFHDSDIRETTNRPLFNSRIVPTTWMDTGIGFQGAVTLKNDAVIDYEAYLMNGLRSDTNGSITATQGLSSAKPDFKADNNKSKAFVGRVGYTPFLGLELGVSGYSGTHDSGDQNNLSMIGFDGLVKSGPFEFVGEWASVRIADNTGTLPGAMSGYYVETRYHFFPDFLRKSFFAEGFQSPTFTAIARWGQVNGGSTAGQESQWTLGLNYRPIQTMVFKIEYEYNEKGADQLLGSVALGF